MNETADEGLDTSRPDPAGKTLVTRDWGLLVRDQDIYDLVKATPLERMEALAGRFVAIHDAIDSAGDQARLAEDVRTRQTDIDAAVQNTALPAVCFLMNPE